MTIRTLVRDIAARAKRKLDRARLEVLTYHFVTDRDHAFNRGGHVVRPTVFRDQLAWLTERYTVVRLSDVAQLRPGPRPYVAITFDDGYLDCIEEAYPVLERANLPATLFVCPSVLDNRDLLWRDKIRYLVDHRLENDFIAFLRTLPDRRYRFSALRDTSFYKWSKQPAVIDQRIRADLDAFFMRAELSPARLAVETRLFMAAADVVPRQFLDYGNHTWSHPILTELSPADQTEEITRADRFLVERGVRSVGLAAPFAPYNGDTIAACSALGYAVLCTVDGASNALVADAAVRVVHRRMAPTSVARLARML